MKFKDIGETYENIIDTFKKNKGVLTTKELYNKLKDDYGFTKTKRSLRLYMKNLENDSFPDIIFKMSKRGKHHLIDKRPQSKEELAKDRAEIQRNEYLVHDEKSYMRLAMESIKKLSNLSTSHHKEVEGRLHLSNLKSVYFIESEKLEPIDINDYDFGELKKSIKDKCLVGFDYEAHSSRPNYVVEPYKLIVSNSLWYLFGKDTEEQNKSSYKTWRIKYIKNVECALSDKYDKTDTEIENMLSNIYSPYFIIGGRVKVKVKIQVDILEEFTHLAHLPGMVEEPEFNDDGSVTITTIVSSIKEIEREIKMWLPYIEVLEPLEYRKQMIDELIEYVNNTK